MTQRKKPALHLHRWDFFHGAKNHGWEKKKVVERGEVMRNKEKLAEP